MHDPFTIMKFSLLAVALATYIAAVILAAKGH